MDQNFWQHQTPQSVPARADQVRNHAGGYVWQVTDTDRIKRFLILGAFATYYATQRRMVRENAEVLLRALETNGTDVVDLIRDVSLSGRAPKNDPALFALAAALSTADVETRRAAERVVLDVARIGTDVFKLVHYLKGFRGWGRLARRALARWYLEQPTPRLAYQVVKYQARTAEEGNRSSRWSHRDVLRLCHPRTADPARNAILHYAVRGELPADAPDSDEGVALIRVYERAKSATTEREIVELIRNHRLTWEFIPSLWIGSAKVWRALLPNLPTIALIRNLARLTALDVLKPFSDEAEQVAMRLGDAEALKRNRVHPLQVLVAHRTYYSGRGLHGDLTWEPVGQVVDALETAFEMAFGAVEPAGKRFLLGIDISSSMWWGEIAGTPLTPAEAAAALALIHTRTEPKVHVMGFAHEFRALPITKRSSLTEAFSAVRTNRFGGTDCALPMRWALESGVEVDTFVVYTDNETWYGGIHPFQALKQYRERTGIPARLVVVGMTSTGFTIADPDDPGTLDVVGFDMATPQIITSFARGEV